jgi:hypothetical protein
MHNAFYFTLFPGLAPHRRASPHENPSNDGKNYMDACHNPHLDIINFGASATGKEIK